MPSSVHCAELAVVLIAGRDGEGQRVDQQVGLRQAVRCRRNPPAAARLPACARRSLPCRFRRWSARSPRRRTAWPAPAGRAPCFSPSSKLIELMIGLPPCSFSAASITGVSVLSITSGAFTERGEAADHLGHLAPSRRGRRRRCRHPGVGALARPARGPWRRSRPSRPSPAARAISCEPLALQRSPMAKNAVLLPQRHLPGRGWRPTGTQTGLRATGAGRNSSPRRRSIASSAAMCAIDWCRSSRRSG